MRVTLIAHSIAHRHLSRAPRIGLPAALLIAGTPGHALGQATSPFMTGATALQTNILAWLTPIAIILVITSVHAASAELAFEQLVLLVKQSAGGRSLSRRDIKSLLHLLVDVVIQCGFERRERVVKEVWFDPGRRFFAPRALARALPPCTLNS